MPLTDVTVPLLPPRDEPISLSIRARWALNDAGLSDVVKQMHAEMRSVDPRVWDVLVMKYVDVVV